MTTSTEQRSDVEYLFDESRFERSALPGAEIQQHTEHFRALRAHGAPCTQLMDLEPEELDADWQLAQLHDTIAGSFSELIPNEPLYRIKQAAIAWQVNLLHSDEPLALVQAGCEWLQGVIDSAEQAETGKPTVWWPGKRGQMSDPRCTPGRWIKATGCRNKAWHVRKASALSTEVVDPETGISETLPAFEARERFVLVAYA